MKQFQITSFFVGVGVLAVIFGIITALSIKDNPKFKNIKPEISVTPTTVTSSFKCPLTEYVDCMPHPDQKESLECSKEYLQWAIKNCSGFKGAAL